MDICSFFIDKWTSLSVNERIEKLQQCENLMSKKQKRKVRTLRLAEEGDGCLPNTEAYYNANCPDYISICTVDDPMRSLLSVIHEGIHAMFDDAFCGRVECIYLHQKCDLKELFHQKCYQSSIQQYFQRMENSPTSIIFGLYFPEEKIAHFESHCYFLELIFEFWILRGGDGYIKHYMSLYNQIIKHEADRQQHLFDIESKMKISYNDVLNQLGCGTCLESEMLSRQVIQNIINEDIGIHLNNQSKNYWFNHKFRYTNIKMAKKYKQNYINTEKNIINKEYLKKMLSNSI